MREYVVHRGHFLAAVTSSLSWGKLLLKSGVLVDEIGTADSAVYVISAVYRYDLWLDCPPYVV
jgi:hypothetical protein